MKKMFVLLLVALLGSQMISAQVRSCVTYDSKRDLNGFKQVILTWKDPFIKSELWPAYVSLINESLKEKGMTIPVTLKGMNFILENTQEYENSYFVQNDYLNGVRVNNTLDYRNVAGNPSNWAVFVYDDVVCMYAKIGCCNSQKPKFKNDNKKVFLPIAEKTSQSQSSSTPTAKPESAKRDTVYVEREIQQDVSDRPERTNVNTYYINNNRPYGYYGMGYYYGYYGGNYCYRYYGGLGYYFTGGCYYSGYTGINNQRIGNSNYTTNGYHFTGGNNRTSRNNQRTGNNYNYTGSNYNFTGGNNRPTGQGYGSTNRGYQSTGNGGSGRSNVSFSPTTSFRSSATTRGGRR